MFVHVDTANTDVLKDAIGVLIDPPADPRVTVSMFATGPMLMCVLMLRIEWRATSLAVLSLASF